MFKIINKYIKYPIETTIYFLNKNKKYLSIKELNKIII